MYNYVEKEFAQRVKSACADIVNQLVIAINNDGVLKVKQHLVGSGAKNLVTQNANEPIDMDYNLEVLSVYEGDWNDCKEIKEYIRKMFNKVLKKNDWADCKDSKSALTTSYKQLKGNKTKFSIDIAIVKEENKTWYRLKHEKTGKTKTDKWYWNEAPASKGLADRVNWLKGHQHWEEVKTAYLTKKNMYLSNKDKNHPSFICYIEAVNEVYGAYNNPNGNKQTKKQQPKGKVVTAYLNMNYADKSKRAFYCSYSVEGKQEIKSPLYDNNTSAEEDYDLAMKWLNKLTTFVTKDKSVTKMIVNTSKYIYDMICNKKIGNHKMNDDEINKIRSYIGRINKLGLKVEVNKE